MSTTAKTVSPAVTGVPGGPGSLKPPISPRKKTVASRPIESTSASRTPGDTATVTPISLGVHTRKQISATRLSARATPRETPPGQSRDSLETTPVPEKTAPKPVAKFVRSASALLPVAKSPRLSPRGSPRPQTARLGDYTRSKTLNTRTDALHLTSAPHGKTSPRPSGIAAAQDREAEMESIRKQVCQLVVRASQLGPMAADRHTLDVGWRMFLEQSYKREINLEKAMMKVKAEREGTRELGTGIFSVNYEQHEAQMQKKVDKILAEKNALLFESHREVTELKLFIEGLKRENERLHLAVLHAGVDIPAPQDAVCVHAPSTGRLPSPSRWAQHVPPAGRSPSPK